MKLELSLNARNVKTASYRVPSSYAVVTRIASKDGSDPEEIGRTEIIENELDPRWEEVLPIDFEPGIPTTVKVNLFDKSQQEQQDDIPLGTAAFELGSVFRASGGTMSQHLECGGTVFVHVQKDGSQEEDSSIENNNVSVLEDWYMEKGAAQRREGEETEATNESIARQWILQERNAAKQWLRNHEPSRLKQHSQGRSEPLTAPTSDTASRGNDSSSFQPLSHGDIATVSTIDESLRKGIFHVVESSQILVFGQVLSFLIASAGAAQASLYWKCDLSAPAFTLAIMYLLLSLHLVPMALESRKKNSRAEGSTDILGSRFSLFGIPLNAPVTKYLLIAFLEVEGQYATLMAFRYTTLTSILLFEALSIPAAMLFSKLFLSRQYVVVHLLGAAFCMSGMLYNVFSDYESDLAAKEWEEIDQQAMEAMGDESTYTNGSAEYPNRLAGDILAIVGALLGGVNDVFTEKAVRNYGGPIEFLAMVGLFGSLVSIVQAVLFEQQAVAQFFVDASEEGSCAVRTRILLLVAFVATNTLRYLGTARFLLWSEAALLNLSAVTVVFWSILFSIFVQRIMPQPLFYVAFTMIIGGVVVYVMGPSPIVNNQSDRPVDVLVPQSKEFFEWIEGSRRQQKTQSEEVEISSKVIFL